MEFISSNVPVQELAHKVLFDSLRAVSRKKGVTLRSPAVINKLACIDYSVRSLPVAGHLYAMDISSH